MRQSDGFDKQMYGADAPCLYCSEAISYLYDVPYSKAYLNLAITPFITKHDRIAANLRSKLNKQVLQITPIIPFTAIIK